MTPMLSAGAFYSMRTIGNAIQHADAETLMLLYEATLGDEMKNMLRDDQKLTVMQAAGTDLLEGFREIREMITAGAVTLRWDDGEDTDPTGTSRSADNPDSEKSACSRSGLEGSARSHPDP